MCTTIWPSLKNPPVGPSSSAFAYFPQTGHFLPPSVAIHVIMLISRFGIAEQTSLTTTAREGVVSAAEMEGAGIVSVFGVSF
jgi:hypothetical protein